MRKIISLLLLQKLSASPPRRRCLSTAAETATRVAQPRTEKSPLIFKVKQKSNSSITDILNEYQNQGKAVRRNDIVSLSNYLRNGKKYQSALQLYDWAESNKTKITNVDQAIRIDLLCKTTGLASAENYFNTLHDSEKTKKTYGALLSCFCREKVLDKAMEIFEKMKELKYMSTLNYNNMMSLYFNVKQPEKVPSLIQEMKDRNIVPDLYSYNQLINSYAALKDFDAAEGVLEKMTRYKVKIDSFTYGNLATVFVYSGLHEKARNYLQKMGEMKNLTEKEDFENFKTRVKLYAEMNDLSAVRSIWTYGRECTHQDNDNHLVIFLALSKMGAVDDIEHIYNNWVTDRKQKRCRTSNYMLKWCENSDFRIPNVILECYLNHNEIDRATTVYENITQSLAEPNLKTLSLLAILFVQKCQIDTALDYLELGIQKAGLKKGDWFPPDEAVKQFLTYFEEKKDLVKVERFVELMKKVNRLDSTVYDSLLSNVKASEVGK